MQWLQTLPQNPFDEARTWKIVASAGCGKSFTIRRVIKDLVLSGVRPDEIMYLIFNRTPADDFKDELKHDDAFKDMEMDFPWVNTHHAIAKRLLGIKSENILTGKRLKEWGDENGTPFSSDDDEEDTTFWGTVLKNLDLKILNGNLDLDVYEAKLLANLKQAEDSKDLYTFSRMVAKSILLEKIPQTIKYVFVDEGQDNSKIQFDYLDHIKTLGQIKGVMVVGDDKQAINLFKGGCWNLFLDWKADRYVCLGKTYRNANKILSFSNSIASPIEHRSPLTQETASLHTGEVAYLPDLESSISDIRKSLIEKKSVYILSRLNKHRYMARDIMSQYHIPLASKAFDRLKRTLIAMRSISSKQSYSYADLIATLPSEESEDGQIKRTAYWKRGVLSKFFSGSYSIESEPEAWAEYQQFYAGELSSPDLSLFGFSPKFLEDCALVQQGTIPRGIWKGFDDEEVASIERIISLYGIDHETVKLSTIHGIKGSECDMAVLITNINKTVSKTEQDNEDEERRVWYVAATRARTKLIICPIVERNGWYTRII